MEDIKEKVVNKTQRGYLSQEAWQKRNGYMTKAYRMEEDNVRALAGYCTNKNITLSKSLSEIIKISESKHNDSSFRETLLNIEYISKDTIIKTFKIKEEVRDKIREEAAFWQIQQSKWINAMVEIFVNEKY